MKIKQFGKAKFAALLLAGLLTLNACSTNVAPQGEDTSANNSDADGSTSETSQGDDTYYNTEGLPIVDETISVVMSGRQGGTLDWQNTNMITFMRDEMGIDITCEPIANDAWDAQKPLMFTTNDLPDIIAPALFTVLETNDYGQQGYLLPINEYLHLMPNFSKYLEEYPNYAKSITSPDGNIYGLGRLDEAMPVSAIQRVYMNKTWLENVNMETPETLDELHAVLTAFKEQDANGNGDPTDEIPMLFLVDSYDQAQEAILSAFGIHYKMDATQDRVYLLQEDDAGELYLANTTDNYKDYLEYMNMLYSEELIDQETFVLTFQEANARAADDRYGFFGTGSAPFAMAGQDPSYDYNWVSVPAFKMNEDDDMVITSASSAVGQITLALSADTEYPEALCIMLDKFFTNEYSYLGTKGVEGIDYEISESDIVPGLMYTNENKWMDSEYSSMGEYRSQKAVIWGPFWLFNAVYARAANDLHNVSDEIFYDLFDNPEKIGTLIEGWQMLGVEYARRGDYVTADPIGPIVFSPEEFDELGNLKTDIITYLKTTRAQFITGELDIEADWEEYLATLDSMGLSELMDIENSAYARTNQ